MQCGDASPLKIACIRPSWLRAAFMGGLAATGVIQRFESVLADELTPSALLPAVTRRAGRGGDSGEHSPHNARLCGTARGPPPADERQSMANTFINARSLAATALLLAAAAALAAPKDRYFISGDGTVRLSNAKSGESARIRYRLPDGSYPARARAQIDHLFGVPAAGGDTISLRLVSLLDYVEDRYRRPLKLISGYRSPEYNAGLRAKGRLAAKASLHMEGMAVDLELGGKTAAQAYEDIKALDCCGVGYYHGASLHLDTGPARYWDETTSKVHTNISEHNKRIMLSPEEDIYLPGETVRLLLARITDYPLGIAHRVQVLRGEALLGSFGLDGDDSACRTVADRKARYLSWHIPTDFRPRGRVQLRLQICAKPHPETPDTVLSGTLAIRAP